MAMPGVLVLFDGSTRSERAVADASQAARETGGRLSVLVLAPVEEPPKCCNCQTTFWNREMRRVAQDDARRVRTLLADDVDADVVVREGAGDAAVRRAAAELGCETIVEPRRLRRSRQRAI